MPPMGLFLHTLVVTMVFKTVFLQRFKKKQFHGLAVELLLTLITSCTGLLPGRQLQIISSAMEPTLTLDEVVRLKKVETIERGDIVAFNLSRVGDQYIGINDDAVIHFESSVCQGKSLKCVTDKSSLIRSRSQSLTLKSPLPIL